MGTALLLVSSSVAPAWAAPAGAAALSAGTAGNLALATPAITPAGACQLNSPRGKIKHVVTIIFDNTHFMRDPARDGSTLVPSDLEQMPHLLNFMKQKGALLSNHHTPLIAHTSDDIITILTGVYPARHGVANAANSYLEYTATGLRSQSAFTYWTDLSLDGAYNLISGPVDTGHPSGVNAPAPWVPFTRAGCDVGAAAAADMLASILLKEEEELTAEILEAAVRALRRVHLRRQLDEVQRQLKGLGPNADLKQKIALSEEARRISLALRDPGPEARAS